MPNQTYRDLKHHHSRHATIIDFCDTLKICSPMKVDGWHVIPFKTYIILSFYTFYAHDIVHSARQNSLQLSISRRSAHQHRGYKARVLYLTHSGIGLETPPERLVKGSNKYAATQKVRAFKNESCQSYAMNRPSTKQNCRQKSPAGRKSNPGPTMALKMATPAWQGNQLDRYPLRWIIRNDSWHLKSAQSMPLW